MRLNYDARNEHKNKYWLAVSGTVLVLIAIVGSLFQVLK